MTLSFEKLSEWLSSRSPRNKKFILSQRNIYIFPSRIGLAFLFLLLLMLLTAINYQNSLIYLVTFFLGTIFFLSIWLCFFNIAGLNVQAIEPGRCFEGDLCQFNYRLSKDGTLPLALRVGLNKVTAESIAISMQDCQDFVLFSSTKTRGKYKLKRLYIESRFPFGLVVAWTWLKLDSECLVYPKPVFAEPIGGEREQGDKDFLSKTPAELNDLSKYEQGDPINRILWKKYAASDQLIIRDYDSGGYNPEWLSWDNYTGSTEERLRNLCYEVCYLSDLDKPFGFNIPGISIKPGRGELHKQQCLDALAMYQ